MSLRRLIVPLALAFSLLFAATAHAYVYWGDFQGGTIGRANLDGTDATDAFISTGGKPFAIAVNGSHIYWANAAGSIGRANLDGTGVEPNFISGLGEPTGVAVTPSYIFWSDLKTDKIGRATLDASVKQPNFISTEATPCGVAVDSGNVYWTNSVGFMVWAGRAPFNGSSPQKTWFEIENNVICGLAVNSANLFWAGTALTETGSTIGRASVINGSGLNRSLIGEADGPCGLAVFGLQLYWANAGNQTIGRANTDGTGVVPQLFQTGGTKICGVAVDSLSSPLNPPPSGGGGSGESPSPPPSPAPSPPTPGTIRLLKLKPDAKHGTAQLKVEVDEAGVVSLAGKGIVPAKATARGAGPVTLSVRATKAKAATLAQTGKLASKLTVTFVPGNGGATASFGRSLTLRKSLAH
jgi:hypothetical protein